MAASSNSDSPPIDPAGRLLAEDAPGDNSAALSVSDLSVALKRTVEDRFGHVRVRGEISGWKRAASGHGYLCLKDDKAVIDGVMWKGALGALRFAPEDGIEVVATGKLTTYPGRSKYQIVIERLELAGAGALMALLDQRRRKLAGEGLFDDNRKRPLPWLPQVIGVVTSPTGAVIRDILHRLADRFPRHVILWPVLVQGDSAAAQVAAAVEGFNRLDGSNGIARPDLLIVARGGGSIEDLWAFNEEVVVRAVAASDIPVISAVGHETDTTLCDFAADRRAPTPTAAAEMAVPVRAELLAAVRQLSLRTDRCAHRGLELRTERATALARRLPSPRAILQLRTQRADELGERLPRALRSRAQRAENTLSTVAGALRPRLLGDRIAMARSTLVAERRALKRTGEASLDRAAQRLARINLRPALAERPLADARLALDRLWRVAQGLNPAAVLQRGYAMVTDARGHIVGSVAEARAASAVSLRFADGAVDAIVGGGRPREKAKAVPPAQPKLL